MTAVPQSESNRWMTRRYALALTVIALLAVSAYTALTLVIAQQESTGALVNISGRQRMLSQRTTLFVQHMLLSRNSEEYEQSRTELRKATDLIERSHDGLTHGDVQLGLPATMSAQVRAMYFEGETALDPHMRRFIAALRQVLAIPFGQLTADRPEIQHILSVAPGPLLLSLDRMVWQYQREGEEVITNLHGMERGVLLMTLLTLLLEVILIFRPMVQQVVAHINRLRDLSELLNSEIIERSQAQTELQAIRDELEMRVAERTADLTREIAEREKMELSLRESEQRFRAVTESAVEAIVTIDAQGSIITWNRGAEQMFLLAESEALGSSVELLMPEPFRARHRQGIARVNQMGHGGSRVIDATLELYGLRRDGTEFPLELSVSSWFVAEQRFYSGILRDISDRKKNEAMLHAAKEEAEAATLAKSQFLATMSHEIRTPINALLGMGELLLETTLTDEQRHFLEISNQSGAALLALINDILDLSKIEAGQMDLECIPFDLHHLLAGTAEILALLARDKGNSLQLQMADTLPRWVLGDPARLRQVLLNLIGNAIKFTQQGCVTISAIPETGEQILFAVADTGIGITPEKQEAIFLPFNQADSSVTRKFGGTGLGLTICRQIIQHAGGRIGVTSSPGEGSIFSFVLPLPPTDAPGSSPVLSTTLTQKRKQGSLAHPAAILLVEDSEENQVLIRAYLKKSNCRLDIAGNGAEAVEKVRENDYDLILMDIQMPVMDGYAATQAIRAWEQAQGGGQSIPIIALTADAMKEAAERAQAVGCDFYLTKPISKKRLLETLAQFFPV
ncbi:MAG: ATP-binding protein [Magnetococcus sp. XQGC-1]